MLTPTAIRLTYLVLGLAWYLPSPALLSAWDWVPTQKELQRYRQSWNPFSHGPMLQTAVDVQPEGQSLLRPFIFSPIGERSFDNRLQFASYSKNGPVHLYSGKHPSLEVASTASRQSFWSRENGQSNSDTGLGDTSFAIKYRPIVQDPDSWRPSVTLFSHVVLPTGKWAGTERPPGGFAPIGRFLTTRFGEVAVIRRGS